MHRPACVPLLVCLLACNGSPDGNSGLSSNGGMSSASSTASTGESSSSSSSGPAASSSTSGAAASTTGDASGVGSSSSTGMVADLGTMPDFGPGTPPGCKGKIDFLFAISASFTMADEQDRLKASFKGFVDAIEQDFADFDYHVMVANIGGINFFKKCKNCMGECPEIPPDYPCDAMFDTCDNTIGAGLTFPNGTDASNKRCELFGGHRYIIKDDPNLLGSFTCIASVGATGGDIVVESALTALSDDLQVCNDGFLRDDALLVVTIIKDGDDNYSQGQPPAWTQALLDAKHGDPDAAVVLIVMPDADDPNGICKPYEEFYKPRLREWSKLLPHALVGSVCAPDYAPFFKKAVDLVKQQCDVFVPG